MGGGSSQKSQTIENKDPWYGQQPYLKDSFAEAQRIYNTNKDNPAYTGDFYAQLRPEQIQTFQNALNYANGPGSNIVGAMGNNATGAMSAGFDSWKQGMAGTAGLSGDNTNTLYANAAKLANSPYADGIINSAMRDANRNAAENVMPSLYRNAAGTGNINSDRTALAEGVVNRGLAEKTADISSQIRGALFDQGLSQAGADLDRRLGAYGAQTQGGGDMFAQGGQLGQGALSGQGSLLDMAGTASDRLQAGDQALIDNAMSKFEYQQSKPWEALQNYYQIIGDKSWGGTTSTFGSVSQKPSALSTIGSVVGALGSFAKLCDERLKIKHRVVGEINGVPLWLFSYIHAPDQLEIGPMAQDLEKVNPDAVFSVGEYKAIDLRKL